MFQLLLIFSPFITLSLLCSALGLRRYKFQQEEPDLDERTVAFILFGNVGLAVSSTLLVLTLTRSRIILLAWLLCSIFLFLGGDLTLRRLIIARKRHFFSSSITTFSAVSALILFPWMFNIHEPFTAIYSGITCIAIVIQIILLAGWKRKKISKKSP